MSKNIEDDSNNIDDRMVNVKELITSKLTKQNRRIDDLIALQ